MEEQKKSEIAKREERILEFWQKNNIFKKTLEKPSPKGEFVFYEGPPTANGRPGIHHVEARAFKDIIPRYKTMQGFRVRRKGGWDTHGLPVELEVEKKLGLKSKKEIEQYGIEKFNEECRKSVWTYVDEWESFTKRMGYFVDLDDPYVTYKPEYIESLWNIVKTVHDKNLLYKDYKVVPWCPRCGTALSSHELAQGYDTVKDLSVFVKFKILDEENTSLLAWTTTPWTLPGNVALAVGENIEYVKVKIGEEYFILAKDRISVLGEKQYEIVEDLVGSNLVGLSYKPLYPFLKDNLPESEKGKLENAFKVYAADFVTTEDGTGIVHTAVMYGQDDFELGTKVGLPKYHLVNQDGNFSDKAGFLAGKFVKDEATDVEIIKNLAHSGLLFAKQKIEHTYPFCWRCKTPLIYYARDSWYIRMSKLRDKLVSENQKINWEPGYIKEGRFGEWLREIKDWAISRERYWGTPLPVWLSEDGSEMDVIGSYKELQEKIPDRISILYFMRHAESEKNLKDVYDSSIDLYKLTETGRREAREAANSLKGNGITAIYTSPALRTRETAEIMGKILGVPVHVADELREVHSGSWEGYSPQDPKIKNERDAYGKLPDEENYTIKRGGNGESWQDVEKRVFAFVKKFLEENSNTTALFITHGGPLIYLLRSLQNISLKDTRKRFSQKRFTDFARPSRVVIDRVSGRELDPHRPHIDEIVYEKNGKTMRRVKEVMDVWFDSGAMPFAQDHYPFSTAERMQYPADYISEAIDQTRGWFYTLHAVGILMDRGQAYKNVICLGHILDKNGQKMSKSKGNTVNPWEMMDKYGVDALRFWMYSVNQPGESKNFDEKTVDEVVKKVFNLLDNSLRFFEMNVLSAKDIPAKSDSKHVMDRWILAYFKVLVRDVSKNLDAYKILEAARLIREFSADLSQWYIRRSRDRFRDANTEVLATAKYLFLNLSKLMAPFTPFFAEDMYSRVKGGEHQESVHLESWPEVNGSWLSIFGINPDEKLLSQMKEVRTIVSLALEARSKANIKVRQPLKQLTINNEQLANKGELLDLIKDEVNVKEVVVDPKQEAPVVLDTNVTEDLRREGEMRELVRALQDFRKKQNLRPKDRITIDISAHETLVGLFDLFREEILRQTNIVDVNFVDLESGSEIAFNNLKFRVAIRGIAS